VALVAWSLFVWTTRIRNIWGDDTLSTSEQVTSTALALSFTVLALIALVTVLRPPARGRVATLAVDALSAWTVAVWAVRVPAILLDDHGAAFKVVHTVLAVVSVALAALAVREVRRQGRAAEELADGPSAPVTAIRG
jgi:hypothetical protein